MPGSSDDLDSNLFISWCGSDMEASTFFHALWAHWKKCLGDKNRVSLSATIIRQSGHTMMRQRNPEMRQDVANMMTHKLSTAEKVGWTPLAYIFKPSPPSPAGGLLFFFPCTQKNNRSVQFKQRAYALGETPLSCVCTICMILFRKL